VAAADLALDDRGELAEPEPREGRSPAQQLDREPERDQRMAQPATLQLARLRRLRRDLVGRIGADGLPEIGRATRGRLDAARRR